MPELQVSCRYCGHTSHYERMVEWCHFDFEADTWTCFHHGRTQAAAMVAAGWARVTEAEWLTEPSRLTGAL